jgi:hypothetical protein
MANVTLSDGRTVEIDLNRVSMREFRALLDKDQKMEDGDATLAKAVGMTPEEVLSLGHTDYRQLVAAFFKAAREPLADPNLPSSSTSA